MRPLRSCDVSGRRYARVPSRVRISDAHAESEGLAAASLGPEVVAGAASDGRHEKMIRRLGVSETPTAFSGPTIPRSMMCGGIVVPTLAAPLEASDQSCGLMR